MFRVYVFEEGEPLDAAQVALEIELHRLGGRVDFFEFTKEDDYLRGNGVVEEPHSFDVTVIVERGGRTHRWTYPSYEGRVSFSPEAIKSSGLVVETAKSPRPISGSCWASSAFLVSPFTAPVSPLFRTYPKGNYRWIRSIFSLALPVSL